MCVIAFSPKGKEAPTEEQIKDMFTANPDGAGYAYNGRNGKVYYKKGFMTVDELLDELKPLDRWKDTNLAVHFRIGTAGKNDAQTCHPFEISTNYGTLRRTAGEGPVLFHNGILDVGGKLNVNSSDTQDFVAAFAPMLKKYSKSKVRDAILTGYINPSKVLLMYAKNKFKMYGDWQKDGDLYVSNTIYKYYSATYQTTATTYPVPTTKYPTTSYNSYYQDDYDYEENWHDEYRAWWKKQERAEELWERVKNEKILWLPTNEQLQTMLNHADNYTSTSAKKDGEMYNYSWQDGCIWSQTYNDGEED